MTRRLLLAAALSLTACGADVEEACVDYVEAATSCTIEAYDGEEDLESYLEPYESYCGIYSGIKDKATADYLSCLTDVFESGDCSSPEAYQETTAKLEDCVYY